MLGRTMTIHDARVRIEIEYDEMPDLKLSEAQIRRLCDLPEDVCHAAVTALVAAGFLSAATNGMFLSRAHDLRRRFAAVTFSD
jgi:hypothetical protein